MRCGGLDRLEPPILGETGIREEFPGPVCPDRGDVKWLGHQWTNKLWASDYFDTMYEYAVELIKKGKAYVDEQTADQIRSTRGTITVIDRERLKTACCECYRNLKQEFSRLLA